jgi:hypothetical protein
MEVIQFIQNDVQRSSQQSAWKRNVLLAGVFLLPAALGILMRDRIDGVFDTRTFIPNVLAILALTFSVSFLFRKSQPKTDFKWGLAGLLLALYFATDRMIFPTGERTVYDSSEAFWRESFRCMSKGSATTALVGVWLMVFAFTISSWPSRRWRAFLSVSAGIGGTIMLGFHCDSSSVEHVLVAHVGQGVLVGAVLFLAQEVFFYVRLKQAFPKLSERIQKLYKIG